jgi:drug/metabolite transporter (DMT)-like permease
MKASSALSGIVFAVTAMACFAVLDTTNKILVAGVPLLMILWVRYMFQAIATSLVMLPRRGLAIFQTQHLWLQLLRGLLLVACSLLAFISLQRMPVAEFTAIGMLTPLAVTLLARFLMHEHVSPLRWVFVVGGMLGALLIVRPGASMSYEDALLPLVMVMAYACFQTLTSYMARTENPMTLHFYTGLVGALLASVLVLGWWTTQISLLQWLQLVLVGTMGTLGHYLLILAFTKAPAATVTPFLYSGIAFATLGGWLVFSHVPDRLAFFGMLLIVLCGLGAGWLSHREHNQSPASSH